MVGSFQAKKKDAQAVGMFKLKTWVSAGKLLPQTPYAKTPLPDVCIVEKNDPPLGNLWQPAFKIVFDRIISMQAVNMQHVNGTIIEITVDFIKSHPQVTGITAILGIVAFLQGFNV